jgi:hypothetical protein
MTAVSLADISAVQETVLEHSADVSTSSTTATQLANDLGQSVTNSVESKNIVTSIANPGGLTGTVTDNTGTPVANVRIVVRTFNDQVTQALTRTDAAGRHTVHVPAGDYIIGHQRYDYQYGGQPVVDRGGTSEFAAERSRSAPHGHQELFSLPADASVAR